MDRSTILAKRKPPPFKPPRPRSSGGITKPSTISKMSKSKPKSTTRSTTKQSSSLSTSRRKSSGRKNDRDDIRVSRTPSPNPPDQTTSSPPGSQSDSGRSQSNSRSRSRSRSPSGVPDYILAEITESAPVNPREELDSSEPMIPSKLLTTLLHRHFQDEKTKIAKDAGRVVAKYVDIFVREALARAAYERTQVEESRSDSPEARGRARAKVDSYLEIEDLEKLAPQMVLDF
ncbi:uncharacterized protein PADG_06612 [Paracoccidioides brasiliensis Pb18]|uniref:CENP-S associating centromere protein X domain-containing protein n=1 Tax=Paracoccidioides brasiliensis (strain Pb18) TaxID=502780 RepID=C1GH76_PARBD|nr:uncharacterized protein PADG_06612 [Paracoccidioides brasiliensis Pb18]EEH50533.2 hypothetical protein PADG_06612 [Paracoccidioides brasiliensis Pb18]